MKLRVVAGQLKGRMITIPDRDQDFRPTRERIRQAIANILTCDLQGAVVADVCAGSGAIGFELLSRGAEKVCFVEKDRYRCQLIKKHAEHFGVAGECIVLEQDVAGFIGTATERFDVIYYDPPYDDTVLERLAGSLAELLVPSGLLLYERRSGTPFANNGEGMVLHCSCGDLPIDVRTYGETEICIIRKSE